MLKINTNFNFDGTIATEDGVEIMRLYGIVGNPPTMNTVINDFNAYMQHIATVTEDIQSFNQQFQKANERFKELTEKSEG